MSGAGQNAVRVMVDPERCMGSGTCMAVAPALFEMGDDGLAHVNGCAETGDGASPVTVPESLEESVLDAEAQCAGECLHTAG